MKIPRLFSKKRKDSDELSAWSVVLPILFDLVCGVLLITLGALALRVTAYALAGVMLLCAVYLIIAYILSEPLEKITHSRLSIGLALAVAGVLLAFNPDYLKDFLPFVWGLALLFGAFQKIQYAFDEKAVNIRRWWILLILAAFSLVIGILSLLNPAFLGESRSLVIGIMLLAEAVIDAVVFLVTGRALKKIAEAPAAPAEPVAPAEGAEPEPAAPDEAPAAEEA